MIPVNPEAIGDPDQTPRAYIGEGMADLLGIPDRSSGHLLYTEEDVDLGVSAILDADLGSYTWERLVKVVLDSLASAGRLVPPGSEVREEVGVRLVYDDDWIDEETAEPVPKPRALVEAWVAFHRRKIEEVPGWRVRAAELISRQVITTPWSVPDTEQEG